jgi:hypothetical protein
MIFFMVSLLMVFRFGSAARLLSELPHGTPGHNGGCAGAAASKARDAALRRASKAHQRKHHADDDHEADEIDHIIHVRFSSPELPGKKRAEPG